jgi:cephalosporin-C deacetylase-like acetyl esterase
MLRLGRVFASVREVDLSGQDRPDYRGTHRPPANRGGPADFDDFWNETLSTRRDPSTSIAKRALAPALFFVGLMDKICPPSTVYAAYHAYGAAKEFVVNSFSDHEGGLSHQRLAQIKSLNRLVGFENAS